MKHSFYLFIFLAMINVLPGCRKFITIPPPTNEVVTATVFTNDESALSAVSGLYSQLMGSNNTLLNGGLSLFCSLSCDELQPGIAGGDADQFFQNNVSGTNLTVDGFWQRAYRYVYHCNAVAEGLKQSININPGLKQQLRGEVLFVRGLTYYYLVQLFGDVPLVLTTDYTQNDKLPRESSQAVLMQVQSDLEESYGLLSFSYPSAGKVRPNKASAAALLARVFLHFKNWDKAVEYASLIISNTQYNLPSDLSTVFTAGSMEAIWQLLPVLSSSNSSEGFAFIPSNATTRPSYLLTGEILNSMPSADKRKQQWTRTVTIAGNSYTYPYKYRVRSGTTKTEYNVVLRLAEQYLIRAEARAESGDIGGGTSDLNIIRQRAGLSNLVITNREDLILAIEQERRSEFFTEWGMRWIDLKRWNVAGRRLQGLKPGWQDTDELYPVPVSQLLRNPNLTQNPGY